MTDKEEAQVQTPEEIMALIAAAGASGDLAEVIRLGNQLKKHQADIQRAEAAKLAAEAEALAGDREKMAKGILKAILAIPNVAADLAQVKATGFIFKTEYLDQNGVKTAPSVALSVPTIKATRAGGGGGGSTGALKAQTGLSRHELVEQYATDAEKLAIQTATDNATTRPDSARYSAEKPIIKRILADNPHLVKR